MSKKQLLNESEIRRFMRLANIEPLGKNLVKENFLEEAPMGSEDEPKAAEYELEEVYGEDSPEGDETMDLGDMGGEAGEGGDKESRFLDAMQTLADLSGIEIDASKAGEGEEEPAEEEPSEEPAGEEDEEGEEEESEEDEEEAELEEAAEQDQQDEAQLQEALVQKVLARVTSRLVAEVNEAKKKGEKLLKNGKTDKKSVKDKMAAMRAKKKGNKKLEEANAPAPKATSSNGPKKGAGSATKGTWGVTSKVADQEWKEGKEGKGGHEMETVSASAEHTITHGKTNLATKGKK